MSSPDPGALPRLIVVTNDEIVARPGFLAQATSIMEACGPGVALQLRTRSLTARALFGHAGSLAAVAGRTGAALFVNERIDIALAAGAAGVQLGRNAVPVAAAMSMLAGGRRGTLLIGASVHSVEEAERAAKDGADLVVLGTIWASASHPDRPGSGVSVVAQAARRIRVPVYAIGGVTLQRAPEVRQAGGYGAAVISGVWEASRPDETSQSFLEALQVKS